MRGEERREEKGETRARIERGGQRSSERTSRGGGGEGEHFGEKRSRREALLLVSPVFVFARA